MDGEQSTEVFSSHCIPSGNPSAKSEYGRTLTGTYIRSNVGQDLKAQGPTKGPHIHMAGMRKLPTDQR